MKIPRPIASADLPARIPALGRTLRALAAGGTALAVVGAIVAPDRMWTGWLVAAGLVLTLGAAGLFFTALQHITRSRWSVAIRRVPEAMGATTPLGAILLAATGLGVHHLYEWSHAAAAADPVLAGKSGWLNVPFWTFRIVLFTALWIGIGSRLHAHSRAQDVDGKIAHTDAARAISALFLVVFAITFNLAAFDWFMSLEPHWYSTVYGVYHFAGMFSGGIAAICVLVIALRRAGPLAEFVGEKHLHDLGRLLFGFSSFWIYIWYCEYMLIWYTNMPEETAHFTTRFQGGWEALFWLNPVLNWAVPFLVLLPAAAKRSESTLLRVALVVLLGRWLDLVLLVAPTFFHDPRVGLWEVFLPIGGVAAFLLAFFRALGRANVIPIRDPYLEESLP